MNETNDHAACDACPMAESLERRAFLRDAAAGVLTALGAIALLPGRGAALPLRFVEGVGSRAAKLYPIPAGDGVAIDSRESVIIARVRDRVYAFSLACPHQNTALRWEARNNRFQCPKHKSRYQPDGVFIEGRATRSMDRFAITREGPSQVQVDLDAMYRQDLHPAAWEAAYVSLAAEK